MNDVGRMISLAVPHAGADKCVPCPYASDTNHNADEKILVHFNPDSHLVSSLPGQ